VLSGRLPGAILARTNYSGWVVFCDIGAPHKRKRFVSDRWRPEAGKSTTTLETRNLIKEFSRRLHLLSLLMDAPLPLCCFHLWLWSFSYKSGPLYREGRVQVYHQLYPLQLITNTKSIQALGTKIFDTFITWSDSCDCWAPLSKAL
jgi:hypothetical protein